MGAMVVLWSFLGVLKHLLAPPLRCPCLLRLKKIIILHLFLGVPAATVGGTGTPVATPLVYKSLNGMAPSYISNLLIEHNVTRSLRSSNQRRLFMPKTRRKCRGDRAFATTAPRLWNDLPLFIRMASSVAIFKSKLKTYLFDKAFYPG